MNKKLKLVLSKMIIENTQLTYRYSSSAKEFQNKLQKAGIVLPAPLYFQYKLPNGNNTEQFEKLANTFEFYDLFPDSISIPKNLTPDEKKELIGYITEQKQIHQSQQIAESQNLKSLNPELSKIDVPPHKITDFLKGASYGFAPEEINYFANEYRGMTDELKQFNENMNDMLGFAPGYILSPKHREMVLNAVISKIQAQEAIKAQQHN
jgi:hypothetical protein